jgi:hypothetical protein
MHRKAAPGRADASVNESDIGKLEEDDVETEVVSGTDGTESMDKAGDPDIKQAEKEEEPAK